MKLLTYEVNSKKLVGALNQEESWVYPISAAGMEYRDMKELIREIGPSEEEMLAYISGRAPYEVLGAAPLQDIKILSPIPVPDQDIICLGINYLEHAKESAKFQKEAFTKPEKAVYFSKRVNRTTDPDEGIPAHTEMFIHGIDEVISELSQGMTLKAGTIIATGTPAGVGMGFEPPRFLKTGDVVECIIEGIGTLKNTVVE